MEKMDIREIIIRYLVAFFSVIAEFRFFALNIPLTLYNNNIKL